MNDQPPVIDENPDFVSKSVRILDILEAAGKRGLRFTEIQAHLWSMSHTEPFTRDLRGYWCTNLLGGPHYHVGLLRHYASKNAEGRWVRNRRKHNEKPWATMNSPAHTKHRRADAKKQHATYLANVAKSAHVHEPFFRELCDDGSL